MTFRFIHTSDWQIGKPFRNFEERVAGRLEGARLAAIDHIADIAAKHGAGHVLVAGDIFDAQSVPDRTLMQPMHRMSHANQLTWWLLPGNHDPASAKGVWERLKASGVPQNIRIMDQPEMAEMAAGVFLLPAPLTARSVASDPTAWMDGVVSPSGSLRIGLAHGSIKGFGSQEQSSVYIDPERAAKAGLNYLALGDWHGSAKINARTWYAGTPEPDRFPDNAPGSVLAVSIDGPGGVPVVKTIPSATYVWAKREFEISGFSDLANIERELCGLAQDPGRLILRLRFQGRVRLDEIAAVQEWSQGLEARVQHLEIETSKLRPLADKEDFDVFSSSEELGEAARYLSAIAENLDDERSPVAATALARLAVLARQEAAGDA